MRYDPWIPYHAQREGFITTGNSLELMVATFDTERWVVWMMVPVIRTARMVKAAGEFQHGSTWFLCAGGARDRSLGKVHI